MKVISTDKAPGAIGPYSQGYIVGGMVYTSGQIPIDPATGEMAEAELQECDRDPRGSGIRSREGRQDDMFPG